MLRATEEWSYVEREVDVRVQRQDRIVPRLVPRSSSRRCAYPSANELSGSAERDARQAGDGQL